MNNTNNINLSNKLIPVEIGLLNDRYENINSIKVIIKIFLYSYLMYKNLFEITKVKIDKERYVINVDIAAPI